MRPVLTPSESDRMSGVRWNLEVEKDGKWLRVPETVLPPRPFSKVYVARCAMKDEGRKARIVEIKADGSERIVGRKAA